MHIRDDSIYDYMALDGANGEVKELLNVNQKRHTISVFVDALIARNIEQ